MLRRGYTLKKLFLFSFEGKFSEGPGESSSSQGSPAAEHQGVMNIIYFWARVGHNIGPGRHWFKNTLGQIFIFKSRGLNRSASECDAVRIEEMLDSVSDVNDGHIRFRPNKVLYVQLKI